MVFKLEINNRPNHDPDKNAEGFRQTGFPASPNSKVINLFAMLAFGLVSKNKQFKAQNKAGVSQILDRNI